MNAVDSAGVLNDFASSTSQQYSLAPFLAAAECLDGNLTFLCFKELVEDVFCSVSCFLSFGRRRRRSNAIVVSWTATFAKRKTTDSR